MVKQYPLFRIDADFVNPSQQPDLKIASVSKFGESLASEGRPCYRSRKNDDKKDACINGYLTSHVLYRETPVVQTSLTVHMLQGLTKSTQTDSRIGGGLTGSYRQLKALNPTSIPVPHLGPIKAVPMKAALGDNYTVGLTFDPLGRRTKLIWNSDATAANVTGGLATSLEGLKGVVDANEGPTTSEQQQTEIDRLSVEYKYNKYKACEAIIEAGGTECPEID